MENKTPKEVALEIENEIRTKAINYYNKHKTTRICLIKTNYLTSIPWVASEYSLEFEKEVLKIYNERNDNAIPWFPL